MPQVKAVIFDFDGVIVESNSVKDDAFKTIFSKYPDVWKKAERYHLENYSTDRFKKFRKIAFEFMGLRGEILEKQIEKFLEEFQVLTRQGVGYCPFVSGAPELLEKLRFRSIPAFLASATPEIELHWILEFRNLTQYFSKAYGSPTSKVQAAQKILADLKLQPKEVVFVGDGHEDVKAAMACEIPFLGRLSGRTDFREYEVRVFSNLFDLASEIL